MTLFFSMLVPGILAAVAITGTVKKVDVYQGLADGAMEGMKILLRILPALVGLLTAVHMLRQHHQQRMDKQSALRAK